MLIEVVGKSTTAVIKQMRGLPELHGLHTTNAASNLTDFDRVLRQVRTIEGLLNSETSIMLSSV
jgi:hypothetical protein